MKPHRRLSRARQGAAAALPVRISRRRVVRRSDASAERRGPAGDRASAARASRRFGDRPFDRIVRPALGDAGRARAGRAVGPLCAARRSARRRGPRPRRGVPFTLSTVSACSLARSRGVAATCRGTSSISSRTAASSREHDRARQGGGLRRADPDRRPGGAGLALSRSPGLPGGGLRRDARAAGAARLAVGRRRPRPAAQPRQPRADRRHGARRSSDFQAWIHANFDPRSAGRTSNGCASSGTGR